MIIGINCGHTLSGQPGCGAVGYIDESVETRKVGNALMELFKKGGHTVINCTNDYAASTSANLNKIAELANAQYLDLFVSIHFNAGGGRGTEVYTYGGKSFGAATDTCKNIAALGFNNRGIKDGSKLYVVRKSNAIVITDREWEAIQSGAISENQLKQIINHVDTDELRKRATPRATTTLSPAKIGMIKSMDASGYTIAEIAKRLSVSTSTVSKYLK